MSDVTATFSVWLGHGESVEVGDDRDGLDMLEIRYRDSEGKVRDGVMLTREHIPALKAAIVAWEEAHARLAEVVGEQ